MSDHDEHRRPGPLLREEVVLGEHVWVARDAENQIIAVGQSRDAVEDAIAEEPVVLRHRHSGDSHSK